MKRCERSERRVSSFSGPWRKVSRIAWAKIWQGDPVRVSFHDVPLVPFINEVFGEELGMSFVISPGLRDKTDLVTLKLTEPLPPRQLFATVRRVLREYGVDLTEAEEGILTFVPSQEIASRDVPLLISGRALPEVPATHRVIFQLVPLKVVRGPQVRGLLQDAFDNRDLKILEDPDRNALLLKGRMDMVAQALAMVEVLDQPLLRGRHSTIIEPVFLEATELAECAELGPPRRGIRVESRRRGRRQLDTPRPRECGQAGCVYGGSEHA